MHTPLRYVAIVLACLISTAPAAAHKLLVECRISGDRLRVEAFYDDDTPAQQAKIVVESEAKRVAAEGRADDRGLWSCSLPAPGKYTVRAESVGHAAWKDLVITGAEAAGSKEKVTTHGDGSTAGFSARDLSSNGSGSNREKNTETPWLRIGIGFAVIAVLCGIALFILKRRTTPLHPD